MDQPPIKTILIVFMKIRIIVFFLFLFTGIQLKAQYYFYDGKYYENDIVFEARRFPRRHECLY